MTNIAGLTAYIAITINSASNWNTFGGRHIMSCQTCYSNDKFGKKWSNIATQFYEGDKPY